MTKKELLAVLAELDLHPSRRLGQSFMVDPNMLDAIVRDAAPVAGEAVLEIGPGLGALTRRLLAAGCRVTAVELDRRLAAYLRRTFADSPGFRLVEGDACRLDLGSLMGEAYRCVSNLPYASSSVILVRLAAADPPPLEIVALLQKEMAARLAAETGLPCWHYRMVMEGQGSPAVVGLGLGIGYLAPGSQGPRAAQTRSGC